MADITAAMVNQLRKRTGCGLMDCKGALKENGGDEEKAIEWLRQKGMAKAAKRADRERREGMITLSLTDDKRVGAMVELLCETDFVARNVDFGAYAAIAAQAVRDDGALADAEPLKGAPYPDGGTFGSKLEELTNQLRENLALGRIRHGAIEGAGWVDGYVHTNGKLAAMVQLSWDGADRPADPPENLGRDLGMQIVAQPPLALRREDVPGDEVAKEKQVQMGTEDLQKKPEQIREKIVEGRMSKWFQERVLLEQEFVRDQSQSVATHVSKAGGGKVELVGYDRLAIGE